MAVSLDASKVETDFNFKAEDHKLDPMAIKPEKMFEESDLGQDFHDDVENDEIHEISKKRTRRKRVKGGQPGKKNYEYPPMKLKCPNCDKMIKLRYLKVHFQKVHKMSKEESCKEAHIVKTVQKVQCSMCETQVWARNMKSHFRNEHNIELSKFKAEVPEGETVKKWLVNASCELCGKVLRKCHLKEHMEFVHKITDGGDISSKMAECPICFKEMRKKNLKQHISAMHEGEKVEEGLLPTRKKQSKELANMTEICPICGKEVKRKSMKQHMINKHEQQIIKEDINDEEKTMCTICGMMYTKKCIERHTARCLKKEAANKTNKFRVDKNLFCETCKRHFMNQEHMNDHKCAHLKCDQCDAEFIRLRNLENHKRGHAGEKLFPCELCEGLFMSRKRCLEHRKYSHNPDYRQQKHQCTQCDAKFTLKTNLNKHVINVHNTTVRQFECQECGKSYKRKDALKVHMHYIHTKDGFCKTCPDCGKKILSHGEFKLHREMFKCKALKAKAKAEKESITTVMEVQPAVVTTVETIVQFPIKLDQM